MVGQREPGRGAAGHANGEVDGGAGDGPLVGDVVSDSGADDPSVGDADVEESADLELMQREIEQLNDRHLRLAAEFDNYRKRVERERAESRVRSQAEVVARLLEPLDDLERVAAVNPETTSVPAVLEGVALVERKLRKSLEAVGLQEVEAVGRRFDPTTMEAVLTAPADGPEQDEVVADVLQKGYRLDGILVRPAKVRVRKHG